MAKTSSKKSEALVSDLFSAKSENVLAALHRIPDEGDARLIIPLLKTYKTWSDNPEIQERIASILGQLKTESAVPELVVALEDPEFDAERAMIISVFWHAGIYPLNDIDVLVKHAIRGDFNVTLEVLTVVENIETAVDMAILQDAIFDIDEFLDEYPEAPHAALLAQLKEVITAMYNI